MYHKPTYLKINIYFCSTQSEKTPYRCAHGGK